MLFCSIKIKPVPFFFFFFLSSLLFSIGFTKSLPSSLGLSGSGRWASGVPRKGIAGPFNGLSPKSGAGSEEPEQGRSGSQTGTRPWHGLLG